MTNKQFAEQVGLYYEFSITDEEYDLAIERFAELVRDDERAKCVQDYLQDTCNAIDLVRIEERQACIDIVETYRIPVGNSPQGELAADWTYAALHEIRDEIKARKDK